MALEGIKLEHITDITLNDLINNQIPEDRTIDYKEVLSLSTPSEKQEFLKDFSAFANTLGGHLIYGMKENKGIPIQLIGQDIGDFDSLKLLMESLIRDCIDPRIWGFGVKQIKLQNNKSAIVIRIPKSFNPPHMVKIGRNRAFYGRTSASSEFLDTGQLRTLFLLSDTAANQTRNFRAERLARIEIGQTPVSLLKGAKLILHLIPFDAFEAGKNYDLHRFTQDPQSLPNIGWPVEDWGYKGYNLDGFCTSHRPLRNGEGDVLYSPSYTQVFRNGSIEAIYMEYNPRVSETNASPLTSDFEYKLPANIPKLLKIQRELGVTPPLFLMLSFLGIKGIDLWQSESFNCNSHPFLEDNIVLPEIMLDRFECDLPMQMRWLFDIVRNAAGLPPK